MEITQLLNCIRSSGVTSPSRVCDTVLMACVNEMPDQSNANHIDFLIRNLSDQALKVVLSSFLLRQLSYGSVVNNSN